MPRTGTTRQLALLGIVLALALPAVLMACGGDEPDADGERAATPWTEAATATTMPGDAPTATDAPRATATKAPLLTIGRGSVETDRETLVALYNATGGESWYESGTWLSSAAIGEWEHVTTDGNGRVTELSLGGIGLSGEIPPELGNLANLQELWLNENELIGEIPPELGNLVNLIDLGLHINELSGEIPPELGNLVKLERLSFHINELSGEIPRELGNLTNLEWLYLHDNQLSGEIPPELGNLANLEYLVLYDNRLSGCVPQSLEKHRGTIDLPFCGE